MAIKLRLELHGEGMLAVHRAGLGGLAISLQASQYNLEAHGLRAQIDDDAITLYCDDARQLVTWVEKVLACRDGVVRLPPERCVVDDLALHEALVATLLQHPGARKKAGESRIEDLEPSLPTYHIKPLGSFAHRDNAKNLAQDTRLRGGSIPVRQWAYPGAVQLHATIKHSVYTECVSQYLTLLFVPVGGILLRVADHALREGAQQYVLLLPELERLVDYQPLRQRLGRARRMVCSNAADAALTLFYEQEKGAPVCHRVRALTFGSLDWSRQTTVTAVNDFEMPDVTRLAAYRVICNCAPFELREAPRRHARFWSVSPWRPFLCDNLGRNQPLWSGLAKVLANEANRAPFLFYGRNTIRSIVTRMPWPPETEQYIAIWKAAMGRYFARRRAQDSATLVNGLLRCRSAPMFSHFSHRFFAENGPLFELRGRQQVALDFSQSSTWRSGRDLALLAIASYGTPPETDSKEIRDVRPMPHETSIQERTNP